MAVNVLSYPFRIDFVNGRPASVPDDSDIHKAEQIAAMIRTNRGERPLLRAFGIVDPSFHRFDVSDFLDCVQTFYAPDQLSVTDVAVGQVAGVDTSVTVEFE